MPGVLICETHGRSGLRDVCEHIARDVREKRRIAKPIYLKCHMGFFAGNPECPLLLGFEYCARCSRELGLPPLSRDISEEEYEQFCELGVSDVACSECLQELIV